MGAGLTSRAVLDKLASIQMLDVHFPTTDSRTLILSRYTEPNPDRDSCWNGLASPCRPNRPRESPPPANSCTDATKPICSVDLSVGHSICAFHTGYSLQLRKMG